MTSSHISKTTLQGNCCNLNWYNAPSATPSGLRTGPLAASVASRRVASVFEKIGGFGHLQQLNCALPLESCSRGQHKTLQPGKLPSLRLRSCHSMAAALQWLAALAPSVAGATIIFTHNPPLQKVLFYVDVEGTFAGLAEENIGWLPILIGYMPRNIMISVIRMPSFAALQIAACICFRPFVHSKLNDAACKLKVSMQMVGSWTCWLSKKQISLAEPSLGVRSFT